MAAGLDSLGAVELRNALEARLGAGGTAGSGGLSLPPTLVFDYPSAAAIAGLVMQRLPVAGGSADGAAAAAAELLAAFADPEAGEPLGPTLAEVEADVAEEVATLLGRSIPADAPLMASGLDSLSSIELRGALQARFGAAPLPATLAMDYPSIAAIAHLLHGRAAPRRVETPAAAAAAHAAAARAAGGGWLSGAAALGPVAVVGMATRLPADGAGVVGPAYRVGWIDAVTPVPQARWAPDGAAAPLHDRAPVRFGAFLPGVEAFDASAFGIAGPEAALMDPQQRLLLEALYEAAASHGSSDNALTTPLLRRAGSGGGEGRGGPGWGVYVGISAVDYSKLGKALGLALTPYTATGSLSLSVAAGRLSYAFGLTGPALSIDTACSSSLVAAHAAAERLRGSTQGGAVAAGVNVALVPDTPAMFQHAGARHRGYGGLARQMECLALG
jgi:acyl carrier protein